MQIWLPFITPIFAASPFLPSQNIPYQAYKRCGVRNLVKSIDEPVRSRRNADSELLEMESLFSENINVEERQARAADTRILNGRELSMEGEWPWMALVVRQGTESYDDARVQCVGVLINCRTVLTTASCAKTVAKGDQVRIGTPVKDDSVVKRDITKIIQHPAFTTTRKSRKLDIHHNNVALLFLDEAVTDHVLFEQGKVGPVCQTDDNSFLNANCWALGVTTSEGIVEAPFISSAVQLDVERQSLKYCNKYGYGGQLDKKQHACIKAKWNSENQGFCQLADNGAPVVCKRENSQNEFFLLGLYSSSEKCETFPRPAIFQETANFNEWIESTIQKEKMCLCHRIVPGRQMISPDKCCLNTPYNSGLRECCGGKLIDLEGPHKCCFGVPYDQFTHKCSAKDGIIYKI